MLVVSVVSIIKWLKNLLSAISYQPSIIQYVIRFPPDS